MSAFAQASVTTQHNDAARTGANLSETVLTTTNVNVSEFGKLFERTVDDEIYAQPLYVEGVNIPGVGVRNVVYVATNNDSVYAFDADDPAASAPLWRVNYTTRRPASCPCRRTDVGQACGTYVDFAGNIGIAGTPAIDPPSQTMYFVTRTKENGTFVQRLHAIDIRDGSEAARQPPSDSGERRRHGRRARCAEQHRVQRANPESARRRCCIDHGTVYITWASYCDQGPYHGWILGYDAATLQQVMVYNTTPDGGLGGIWQSGGGLSADADRQPLRAHRQRIVQRRRGRKEFREQLHQGEPGWHAARLVHTVQLVVPERHRRRPRHPERAAHSEHQSGRGRRQRRRDVCGRPQQHGALPLRQQRADRPELSGVVGRADERVAGVLEQPDLRARDLSLARGDPLKVFRWSNGLFRRRPARREPRSRAGGMPGGHAVAVGERQQRRAPAFCGRRCRAPATPTIHRSQESSAPTTPSNVTRELWNSQQNATRDALGNFSKFSPPTVANGKVFVADPVEQAGGLRPHRTRRAATPRRWSTPARIRTCGARHSDADRHRDRRRQSDTAGTADDDVDAGQRTGAP